MTALERAARVACAAAGYQWYTDDDLIRASPDTFPIDTDWLAATRAVIAAIREPSEMMLKAADAVEFVGPGENEATGEWQAMIDALLAEGE